MKPKIDMFKQLFLMMLLSLISCKQSDSNVGLLEEVDPLIFEEACLASIGYKNISLKTVVQERSLERKYGKAKIVHQSIESIDSTGGRYIVSCEIFGSDEEAKKRMKYIKDPIDLKFDREWGDKTSVWNEGFRVGNVVYVVWTEADAFGYNMIKVVAKKLERIAPK